LETLTLTDDLTGLYNRRGFLTMAGQAMKLAQRMGRGVFLLYADVDNLKKTNDTWGHPEGDRVLRNVAHILRETFREPDLVARIGGDEFVVLAMEGDAEASGGILMDRLQKNLDKENQAVDCPHKLSLSLGVVRHDPRNPSSIEDLLAQADQRMYEEKQKKK
jgi:diguanylate cyclase (GGDEF)-like protein